MAVLIDFIKAYETFKSYGLDVQSLLASRVDKTDSEVQKDFPNEMLVGSTLKQFAYLSQLTKQAGTLNTILCGDGNQQVTYDMACEKEGVDLLVCEKEAVTLQASVDREINGKLEGSAQNTLAA